MRTTYLNPFNQHSLEILKNYGNITQINQTNTHINNIIENTENQEPKKIDTIKEICYEKIRYYYHNQTHKNNKNYKYLFNQALEQEDIISTHALLQATAITYGSQSLEADTITHTIQTITEEKLKKTEDTIIDETINEYIDIHNTKLEDITPLINNKNIKLSQLVLTQDKLIITYQDFLTQYKHYLKHRRPEKIYEATCQQMKKTLLAALTTQKIKTYMQTIETKLKQIEPAPIIKEIGNQIKNIQEKQRQTLLKTRYKQNTTYTNYDEDQPTNYMFEAFPPCIQKALQGTKSGGRNYTINLFLTPFLSYARLYPGVYARHIKNPKITDFDTTLKITQEEIIPLIHEAAGNCRPPLFEDQPQEKNNINHKLGFGEGEIAYENSGKTPWYTPANCESIQRQQPSLCTPCKDCQRIGNPLSYYNRKRKILSKEERRRKKGR